MKEKESMIAGNLFDLKEIDPLAPEWFEELASNDNLTIERIVSHGQTTPPGEWYDQPVDEWVVLIQGTAILEFEETPEVTLQAGEYLRIKAHQKHRVTYTSSEPPCIWLAVHAKNLQSQ